MIIDNIDNTNKPTATVADNSTHMPELPKSNDTKKVSLRDVIIAELQDRIRISKDLQHKINEAKTKPKKDLYLKKIRKNNETVADLLVAMQRLEAQERMKVSDESKQQTDEDTSKLA